MILLSKSHLPRTHQTNFTPWLLFMVALLVFSSVGHANTPPLKTETITHKTLPDELLLDGTIEAVQQATLTAQVSGEIIELNFDVNDYVNKGQVLLRFKGKRNQAALQQANARKKEAEARFRQAKREHGRLKKLFDKKTITVSAMDKAIAALNASKARLNASKAQIKTAEETVSDTVIYAPFSGFVLERFVELGEVAQVGSPLFSGMSMDALRVRVSVPQSHLISLQTHKTARIFSPLSNTKTIESTQFTFFPYADPKSHTVTLRVTLPLNVKGFYPGMFVKIAFKTGESNRLLIPTQAIIKRSEVTGVYVIGENQTIQLRHIHTGRTFDNKQTEVLAGLSQGEKIALNPILAGQRFHKLH